MPPLQQLIDIFETAGWNEELITEFVNNLPKGIYNSRSDVEVNQFLKAWFEDRISNIANQATPSQMTALVTSLLQARSTLDEPFVSSVIKVTKKLLNRNAPYHDNDHEWFALQDALADKTWRRITVIVNMTRTR